MKKLLVLLALSALMATAAFAQADTDPNGIGVYFDLEATQVCTTAGAYQPVDAYLILTNLTAGGVGGFECSMDVGGFAFGSWTLTAGTNGDQLSAGFYVGIGTGSNALTGDNVMVAHYNGVLPTPETIGTFTLSPYPIPSIPGVMCYSNPLDAGDLIPLQVSVGSYELPAAMVNGPCGVVPSDPQSWGSVKALF